MLFVSVILLYYLRRNNIQSICNVNVNSKSTDKFQSLRHSIDTPYPILIRFFNVRTIFCALQLNSLLQMFESSDLTSKKKEKKAEEEEAEKKQLGIAVVISRVRCTFCESFRLSIFYYILFFFVFVFFRAYECKYSVVYRIAVYINSIPFIYLDCCSGSLISILTFSLSLSLI